MLRVFAGLMLYLMLLGFYEASANDLFKQRLSTQADKLHAIIWQLKGFRSATSTFRDIFAAYPGDMIAAELRLPNCQAPCRAGNGNGRIDGEIGTPWAKNDERVNFWIHLERSSLIDIEEDPWEYMQNADTPVFMPSSAIGGVFHVGYHEGGFLPFAARAIKLKAGHYFVLTNSIKGDFSEEDSHFLTSEQAHNIDLKLDDGFPKTGNVMAFGHSQCQNDQNEYLMDLSEPCFSLLINLDSN